MTNRQFLVRVISCDLGIACCAPGRAIHTQHTDFVLSFLPVLSEKTSHIFGGKRADFVTTLRTVNNRDLTVLNLDLQLLRELESAAPTL